MRLTIFTGLNNMGLVVFGWAWFFNINPVQGVRCFSQVHSKMINFTITTAGPIRARF